MRLAASLVLIAWIAGPAAAQAPLSEHDGPSFECGEATSEAEKLVCADPDLWALDWRLEERFRGAVRAIEGAGGDREADEAELRSAQLQWVGERDDCMTGDDPSACVRAAYLRREAQLVALYLLETPSSIVTWSCGGDPGEEIVTYFYDTEQPGVRIERADTSEAGVLVPSGSGSRYTTSRGAELWVRGGEATWQAPDGTTSSCVAVA